MFKVGLRIIKRQILSLFGVPQLRSIFICPSHDCNANCVHCYEKFEKKKEKNLKTETVKNIIDQFHELGGIVIFFCSGEFLLRKDAVYLIKYAKSLNIVSVVVSNGILLDAEKIDELKKAKIGGLIVSLDSANEKRHDELRGVKGCFKKAINAIKIAKRKKVPIAVWGYVTRQNVHELDGLSKLMKKIKPVIFFVYLPLLSGNLFNRFDINFTLKERNKLRKKFHALSGTYLEFPTENSMCMGGGVNHIAVMPSGDITFCPPVVYSYGNIYKNPLKKTLSKIKKDHKRFGHCSGQCPINFKEYRKKCNGKFMY